MAKEMKKNKNIIAIEDLNESANLCNKNHDISLGSVAVSLSNKIQNLERENFLADLFASPPRTLKKMNDDSLFNKKFENNATELRTELRELKIVHEEQLAKRDKELASLRSRIDHDVIQLRDIISNTEGTEKENSSKVQNLERENIILKHDLEKQKRINAACALSLQNVENISESKLKNSVEKQEYFKNFMEREEQAERDAVAQRIKRHVENGLDGILQMKIEQARIHDQTQLLEVESKLEALRKKLAIAQEMLELKKNKIKFNGD